MIPSGFSYAVDMAYPASSYSEFDWADAVLGYAGGETPHVWSGAEIAVVRSAGKKYAPIYTVPLDLNVSNWGGIVGQYLSVWAAYKLMVYDLKWTGMLDAMALDIEESLWRGQPSAVASLTRAVSASTLAPKIVPVYAAPTHFVNMNRLWAWHLNWTVSGVIVSGAPAAPSKSDGWYMWQFGGNLRTPGGVAYDADIVSTGIFSLGDIYNAPEPAPTPVPVPDKIYTGSASAKVSYNATTNTFTIG